jgi:hypothetical protein
VHCYYSTIWNENQRLYGLRRPPHHSDYPDEAKTNWSSAIRNYTDKGKVSHFSPSAYPFTTAKDLLVVKIQTTAKANKEIEASVGALQQNHPEQGEIFITAYIDGSRWIMTYSKTALAALDSNLPISFFQMGPK